MSLMLLMGYPRTDNSHEDSCISGLMCAIKEEKWM